MKLDDVYKAWISVKKRQVKTSSLASYQQIYVKKLSPIRMYGSWGIEQKGYCAIHERSYG